MKKLFILTAIFALFSCNDDFDDLVSSYKTRPKSQELVGFWQLQGVYPPSDLNQDNDIGISHGLVGIGPNEILFFDTEYLRFLNKSSEDNSYYYNKEDRLYWYNTDILIKSVYESSYNTKNYQNIQEYQLPFKFGQLKDTLIVQSNGKILYLIKKADIKFTEYDF